eukprot:m.258486 g.258486  ORF g.258486 m.258486 type:complete len:638 (-) comp21575_c0_seq1:270-2183(-)
MTIIPRIGLLALLALASRAHAAGPRIATADGTLMVVVPAAGNFSVATEQSDGRVGPAVNVATVADVLAANNQVLAALQVLNSSLQTALSSIAIQQATITTQSTAIDALSHSLNTETSRAQAAESAMAALLATLNSTSSSGLHTESSRATMIETTLSAAVGTEIERASSTEASLAGAASSASLSLSLAVQAERSRAIVAEISIVMMANIVQTSLAMDAGAARSRAAVAEGSLAASVSITSSLLAVLSSASAIETSRAVFVEGSLGMGLSQETSRALLTDGALSTATATAASSIASLSTATAQLSSAIRASTNQTLTAITLETSRASVVELSLATSSVALETSRAMTVEASLGAAVAAETARARAAENALNQTIVSAITFAGTCRQMLAARPGAPSGNYDLLLPGWTYTVRVYCDMTTLGGGWTLIGQTVATVTAQDSGAGGFRNLYNLRTGGGTYSGGTRGASTWSLPNAMTIAQQSTQMFIARWATPAAGNGDISSADAAAYFAIPDPSVVTFANPSYKLSNGDTTLTGPCVAVTVYNIKGTNCQAGCTRYTYKYSLGTTWLDSYPTNVGVSVSSSCYNDYTGGPALVSDDSGSYNPSYVGSWGKTSVAGGSPYYFYQGLWDAASTGYSGLGTVWLR